MDIDESMELSSYIYPATFSQYSYIRHDKVDGVVTNLLYPLPSYYKGRLQLNGGKKKNPEFFNILYNKVYDNEWMNSCMDNTELIKKYMDSILSCICSHYATKNIILGKSNLEDGFQIAIYDAVELRRYGQDGVLLWDVTTYKGIENFESVMLKLCLESLEEYRELKDSQKDEKIESYLTLIEKEDYFLLPCEIVEELPEEMEVAKVYVLENKKRAYVYTGREIINVSMFKDE